MMRPFLQFLRDIRDFGAPTPELRWPVVVIVVVAVVLGVMNYFYGGRL